MLKSGREPYHLISEGFQQEKSDVYDHNETKGKTVVEVLSIAGHHGHEHLISHLF